MTKLLHGMWRAGLLALLATCPALAQQPVTSGDKVVGRLPGFFTIRPQPAPVATPATPAIKRPEPVILLNSRLIVSYAEFSALDPAKIEKLAIYKGNDTPNAWRSLVENGIVDVTLSEVPAYASVRVMTLGRRLKLRRPMRYELNGLPLHDQSLRISKAALAGVDLRPPADASPGTVLNVRVLQGQAVSRPGEFYIRGLSQL